MQVTSLSQVCAHLFNHVHDKVSCSRCNILLFVFFRCFSALLHQCVKKRHFSTMDSYSLTVLPSVSCQAGQTKLSMTTVTKKEKGRETTAGLFDDLTMFFKNNKVLLNCFRSDQCFYSFCSEKLYWVLFCLPNTPMSKYAHCCIRKYQAVSHKKKT